VKIIRSLLLLIVINLCIIQTALGQQIDTTIYRHLLEANHQEFINYSKSIGLETSVDSMTNLLTAKKKGMIFFKQISDTSKTEYKLEMIVSSLDKENNKTILRNAKIIDSKADMWRRKIYL